MKKLIKELSSIVFWMSTVAALFFSILFFAVGGYVVLFLAINPWWLKLIFLLIWGCFLYAAFKVIERFISKKLDKNSP